MCDLRSASVAALLLVAAPLHAGVVYDFITTINTPRYSTRHTGRMAFEGRSYRADLSRSAKAMRGVDVIISNDGDATAMYVDLQSCTWSYRRRIGPVRSSGLFHLPSDTPDEIIGRPHIEHRVESEETIAGYRAVKHVVDVRYRVVGIMADSPVRGTVTTRAVMWTVAELPAMPAARDIRTGHQPIDNRLKKITDSIEGMIVRHELTVTRAFDGGPPQTEKTATTLENLRVAELPDELFQLPDDMKR